MQCTNFFFYFTMAVTLLVGCRQREDVDRLKIINQGWENANNIIKDDNRFIGENLVARALIPRSKYYGEKWEPRGNRIRKEADSLVVMIESIKCLRQTEIHSCRVFDGIAVLSSSYVKQGQPIEVTAGIADFDTAREPRIMVGGKEIAIDKNDGAAVYRFAAKGTPGKYKIRVEFEYTKPDGVIERV